MYIKYTYIIVCTWFCHACVTTLFESCMHILIGHVSKLMDRNKNLTGKRWYMYSNIIYRQTETSMVC